MEIVLLLLTAVIVLLLLVKFFLKQHRAKKILGILQKKDEENLYEILRIVLGEPVGVYEMFSGDYKKVRIWFKNTSFFFIKNNGKWKWEPCHRRF